MKTTNPSGLAPIAVLKQESTIVKYKQQAFSFHYRGLTIYSRITKFSIAFY
jgi:hypothetical protein